MFRGPSLDEAAACCFGGEARLFRDLTAQLCNSLPQAEDESPSDEPLDDVTRTGSGLGRMAWHELLGISTGMI